MSGATVPANPLSPSVTPPDRIFPERISLYETNIPAVVREYL